MKTMILVGSADTNSHSLGLGTAIRRELDIRGVETELINLSEYGLPFFSREVERADSYNAKTRTFLNNSHEADAFVWVTPIYHNSFSSVLKNALDWQHTKFPGKVVGLASNVGDRSPQAIDQLMVIARAQHLVNTRTRVATHEGDFNQNKQLTNPGILERVKNFSEELIDLAERIG